MGREALRKKGGENSRRFWDNPTPEQLAAIAAGRERGWAKISPEERSRRSTERNVTAWASYDDDERKARGEAISNGILRTSSVLRSEKSRRAALKALEKEGANERLSSQVRNWWASLTPEEKAVEMAKRAESRRRNRELKDK